MVRISLEGIEFYAYHGVLEEERKIGGRFTVDISFEADVSKAVTTDNISDTVNYQEVYEAIKKQMEIPSRLIEHVTHRILEEIKTKFPVKNIDLKVSKLRPPINGNVEKITITI